MHRNQSVFATEYFYFLVGFKDLTHNAQADPSVYDGYSIIICGDPQNLELVVVRNAVNGKFCLF